MVVEWLGIIKKQPAEIVTENVDFKNVIRSGEVASSVAVAVFDNSLTNVTNSYISGTPTTSSNGFTQFVLQAGSHGDYRDVRVRLTTDAGNVYEEDLLLRVWEIGGASDF